MDKTMVALNPNPASVGETSSVLPQQTPVVSNGQSFRQYPYADSTSQSANAAPVANYQQLLAQIGDVAPGAATNITNIVEKINERGWFNAIYPEGSSQQSLNVPPGPLDSTQPGQFPYPSLQKPTDGADESTSAYLPPQTGLPALPDYFNPPGAPPGLGGVREQQPAPWKTPHQDDSLRNPPEYLDERRYHEDEMYRRDPFQDEPYGPPPGGEPYFGPRMRGRVTPPLSPPGDEYYDYQHGAAPPPRRPPPQHHPNMRGRGMRPPLRPPMPGHHLRGHPRPPFPGGPAPEPWLRGKRPGPRRGGGPSFPRKGPLPRGDGELEIKGQLQMKCPEFGLTSPTRDEKRNRPGEKTEE
ncbi:hypothetical protein WMY93_019709 [Mugilogobius chulae]|uniref:Uncharacterized protein n=1 Tax=Mugilogobius chulae TaxID=88201 RepID=A0AAW0NRX6_9GOBI